MGFTKLDERILQSSIMAESAITFKVWIALLAACRENGMAYVSPVYLSSICHLPISRVEDSIKRLEGPDEHSRSLADDGRRIRRVDGGFEIINYTVYRDFSLRDAEAERKRIYRQRLKGCPDNVPDCPDSSASVSASASASEFESWWSLYPRKIAKKVAAKAYAAAIKAGASQEDLVRAVEGYRAYLRKNKTEERYCQHASTFLREDRWRDYLDVAPTVEVGAHKAKDKPPAYWARVRELQAQGMPADDVSEAMKKWEGK